MSRPKIQVQLSSFHYQKYNELILNVEVNEEVDLLFFLPLQALCFAALGFIFMIMSLSFIITDWVTGESRSGGGH